MFSRTSAYSNSSLPVECTMFYRYGFNGKEKDNEIYGTDDAYDFGARIYDSRLGRWLAIDRGFKKYADVSPFAFGKNNPIVFVDPDGNTDFYTADGGWLGNDGTKNNARAIVTSRTAIDNIKASTSEGMNYTKEIPKNSLFQLPPDNVLKTAVNVFSKTINTDDGKVEYGATFKFDSKSSQYEQVGEIRKGSESDPRTGSTEAYGTTPPAGEIDIHSHPTAVWTKETLEGTIAYSVDATDPSKGATLDEGVFKNHQMNIIVGKEGTVKSDQYILSGKRDNRRDVVAFFDSNAKSQGVFSTTAISNIYNTDTNKKGSNFKDKEKFEKKQAAKEQKPQEKH